MTKECVRVLEEMGPQCEQLTSAELVLGIDSFHAHIVMPEKFLVINGIVGPKHVFVFHLYY